MKFATAFGACMGSSAMVKLPRDVSTRACGGGVAMLVVAPGGGIGCAIAADSPNAAAARLIGNRRAMIKPPRFANSANRRMRLQQLRRFQVRESQQSRDVGQAAAFA